MANPKAMRKKIGDRALLMGAILWAFLCGSGGLAPSARAAQVSFRAEVDQPQIGLEESVSLKLILSSDGNARIGRVRYEAPDFDEVNEFNSSQVSSRYENGRFSTTVTQSMTKLLRPRRTGTLAIKGIQVDVDGKTLQASDIAIQVVQAGAGTPPPKHYRSQGGGLRGGNRRGSGPAVMIRAEIDKDKVYKGEQLIVSYYLYRRTTVYNIEASKFPELKGFLREEIAMPLMGTRLESDRVVLDGVVYDRSLLVRYAAYPLQEGTLRIDPLGIKYVASAGSLDDGEDPFTQFFRMGQTRPGSVKSEPIGVEVLSLPLDGRPASFSGGVGDFNVTSAIDKTEVRANEAVTLTVKVDGRGNLAAIGEPKAKWPETVELYDSKGVAKSGKGGIGEKIFEFLLIPRSPGKLVLPPLEFSFFDPSKKAYVTRSTEKAEINVLEPAPGSAAVQSRANRPPVGVAENASPASSKEELRPLKLTTSPGEVSIWHWISRGAVGGACLLLLVLGLDLGRQAWGAGRARRDAASAARSRTVSHALERLKAAAGEGGSDAKLREFYDGLEGVMLDSLEALRAVGARSLPRAELRQIYVSDVGLPEELWQRINRILEHAELARFAGSHGNADGAKELRTWASEAESVVKLLERHKNPAG